MTKTRRLLLGIPLGAAAGAGLVAGIIHVLPADHKLNTVNASSFIDFLQFVTNDLRLNSEHFLIGSGAVLGAVTGILLVRVIPNQTKWLATVLALMAGIFIGGIAMYFPSAKWVGQISAMWEHSYEGERALALVRSLAAIDRATTNHLYLVNFQQRGRAALTSYVHEAERWETNSFENPPTESVAYKQVKKYLAAHPQD